MALFSRMAQTCPFGKLFAGDLPPLSRDSADLRIVVGVGLRQAGLFHRPVGSLFDFRFDIDGTDGFESYGFHRAYMVSQGKWGRHRNV